MSEKRLVSGKTEIAKGFGPTEQVAFQDAQHRIPQDARVINHKIISRMHKSATVEVEVEVEYVVNGMVEEVLEGQPEHEYHHEEDWGHRGSVEGVRVIGVTEEVESDDGSVQMVRITQTLESYAGGWERDVVSCGGCGPTCEWKNQYRVRRFRVS